jgi:hypothetical protein
VLCFVRDEPLTGWARDVMVCSTANVAAMLLSRPAVLGRDELRQLMLDVDAGVRAATKPVARPRRPKSSASIRASRPRSSRTRSGGSKSSWRGLVPAVLGLALAFVLVTQPELVTGVADRVADVVVGQSSPDDEQPPPKKSHRQEESGRR